MHKLINKYDIIWMTDEAILFVDPPGSMSENDAVCVFLEITEKYVQTKIYYKNFENRWKRITARNILWEDGRTDIRADREDVDLTQEMGFSL